MRTLALSLVLLALATPHDATAQGGLIGKAKAKAQAGAAKLRGQSPTDSASGDVVPPPPGVASLVEALEGGRAVLRAPLFAAGSAELTPDAKAVLDSVATALKQLRGAFLVEGHVDAGDEAAPAQELTARRALAVKTALVRAGVKADRLWAIGFGAQHPVPQETSGMSAKKLATSVLPGAGVVTAAKALRGNHHPENERIELARVQ